MSPNKDYYSILGVLPTAEDAVIRAAYKALAQRYHPDRNSSADAKERMAEINEAYGVLSDSAKRKAYDEARGDSPASDYETYQSGEEEVVDAFLNEIGEKWAMAVEYFPDAEDERRKLAKISKRLAFSYQLALLDTQKFAGASFLAAKMRDEFIATYFGDGWEMRDFVLLLIQFGRRDALLELNKVIKVLGTGKKASKQIRERITEKYGIVTPVRDAPERPPQDLSAGRVSQKESVGALVKIFFALLGIGLAVRILASLFG
jgi:curved DNA-binding protein CbpA